MALNKKSETILNKLSQEALSGITDSDPEGKTEMIDVNLIDENPDNAKVFDMEEIDILAKDIKKYGFRGAIEVIPVHNGRYQIVSGHRRFRAVKLLGQDKIRCFVSKIDINNNNYSRLTVEELLLSNMRNRNISAIQKSNAIQLYFDKVLDVYYPKETKREKIQRACDFFGLKSSIIARLLGFQSLNERLKEYLTLPGFPAHGLGLGTKSMTDDEITLLIDEIEHTPGFSAYKEGADSCPLSVRGLNAIVHKVLSYRDIVNSSENIATQRELQEDALPVNSVNYEPVEKFDVEDTAEDIKDEDIVDNFEQPIDEEIDNSNDKDHFSADEKVINKLLTPQASSTQLNIVQEKADEVEYNSSEPVNLYPTITAVTEKLEQEYYQLSACLKSIPIEVYADEDKKSAKVIITSITELINEFTDRF